MPARPLVALALAAALLPGCSGSAEEAASTTSTDAVRASQVPATRAELLWLGEVDAWYTAERESSTLAECTLLFDWV